MTFNPTTKTFPRHLVRYQWPRQPELVAKCRKYPAHYSNPTVQDEYSDSEEVNPHTERGLLLLGFAEADIPDPKGWMPTPEDKYEEAYKAANNEHYSDYNTMPYFRLWYSTFHTNRYNDCRENSIMTNLRNSRFAQVKTMCERMLKPEAQQAIAEYIQTDECAARLSAAPVYSIPKITPYIQPLRWRNNTDYMARGYEHYMNINPDEYTELFKFIWNEAYSRSYEIAVEKDDENDIRAMSRLDKYNPFDQMRTRKYTFRPDIVSVLLKCGEYDKYEHVTMYDLFSESEMNFMMSHPALSADDIIIFNRYGLKMTKKLLDIIMSFDDSTPVAASWVYDSYFIPLNGTESELVKNSTEQIMKIVPERQVHFGVNRSVKCLTEVGITKTKIEEYFNTRTIEAFYQYIINSSLRQDTVQELFARMSPLDIMKIT